MEKEGWDYDELDCEECYETINLLISIATTAILDMVLKEEGGGERISKRKGGNKIEGTKEGHH